MNPPPSRTCDCNDCLVCEFYAARLAHVSRKRPGDDTAALILDGWERAREVAEMRARALESALARARASTSVSEAW